MHYAASNADSIFFSRPPHRTASAQEFSRSNDNTGGPQRRRGLDVYLNSAGTPSSSNDASSEMIRRRLPYGNTISQSRSSEAVSATYVSSVVEEGSSNPIQHNNNNNKERSDKGFRYNTRSITRSRTTANASLDLPIGVLESPSQKTLVSDFLTRCRSAFKRLLDRARNFKINAYEVEMIVIRVVILVVVYLCVTTLYSGYLKASKWEWSHDRHRQGRQCVIHFFIEKYSPDEYDPDRLEATENDFAHRHLNIEETYRSAGQVKVITRLISSVANTFRVNTTLNQHIIFSGARDGGHLAELALRYWPRRGDHHTQLHIVAADSQAGEMDPLKYSFLHGIEERFHGRRFVHVYDRHGLAGATDDDDDDVEETPDHVNVKRAKRKNHVHVTNTTADLHTMPYPSLQSFLPVDDPHAIIPYLHVDGIRMSDQLEILESARPLFVTKTVVIVGIEHSPDLDIHALLDFFDAVNYKTFFLGSRQLARIDNLCPEILSDVLQHPTIHKEPNLRRHILSLAGRSAANLDAKRSPPFFVAMPRGRIQGEEMTIQHSYDLFGGLDGSSQLTTANDRDVKK